MIAPARRLAGLLSICLVGAAQAQSPFPDLPAPPDDPPVEVMLVGVFHFAQTDTTVYDPLDAARQREIEDVVDRLAAFAPTQVMVEWQPYFRQRWIDSTYAEYRAGRFELGRNEVYQLGYRLANRAGLGRVWAVDHAGYWLGDTLRTAAGAFGQMDLLDGTAPHTHPPASALVPRDSLLGTGTTGEILAWLSSPRYQAYMYDGYVNRLLRVGMREGDFPYDENEVGGDLLAEWVRRNILIYRMMLARVEYDADERVVLFIGADHVAPIRQFFEANYTVRVVEVGDYLD